MVPGDAGTWAGERADTFVLAACVAPAARAHFTGFFEQTIGRWSVVIRDFDERGTVTYEGSQERVFAWTIGERWVEEKAYTVSEGGLRELGLMLHSFDDETGAVLTVSYWPRSPRRWAEFEGCIAQGTPRLEGMLRSWRPGEAERVRRIEITFESASRIAWRSYAPAASGAEYLAEELVYSRPSGSPF